MKYLILFILTILAQLSFGQNDLHGVVLDSVSNDPIPFASIFLTDQIKTTSDFDGKFQIEQIDHSTDLLEVSAVGYPTKKFKVQPTTDSLMGSSKNLLRT